VIFFLVNSGIGRNDDSEESIAHGSEVNYLLMEIFRQDWIGNMFIDNKWEDAWKRIHSYDDNGNLTEQVDQVYNGGNWKNEFRTSFYYDSKGNISEKIDQNWFTHWENYQYITFSYDTGGNRIE